MVAGARSNLYHACGFRYESAPGEIEAMLLPLTEADIDAMTFKPGELDLLLTPFDAEELISIDESE